MSQVSAGLCAKLIPGKVASTGVSAALLDDIRKWPYQAAQLSCQNLLATSSYREDSGEVLVFDVNSMQLVQTLHGHTSPVSCVQWKQPSSSYTHRGLFLFTGDMSGVVKVWDVTSAVVVNSVQLPKAETVCVITVTSRQHVLILTQSSSCFVYDLNLAGSEPCGDHQLVYELAPHGDFVPLSLNVSKLSEYWVSCVVLGDRIGVIYSQELEKTGTTPHTCTQDLVYPSDDNYETVVDAVFSDAQEGILYFATRGAVGVYDWKAGMFLDERVLWYTSSDVEFRRLYSSFPATLSESRQQLPLLYSFGSNQKLTAWYKPRVGKVSGVSVDVRGARIVSKVVTNVVQSETAGNLFAVIFSDGSVARWRYRVSDRRWVLEAYYFSGIRKPSVFCLVGNNVLCCALEAGYVVLVDVIHGTTLRRINFVHTSGTQIILLAPHTTRDSVWVVTHKGEKAKQYHQVTLFDWHSGVVLQVLRKPTYHDESLMKDVTVDVSGTFLLLTFLSGAFEVWNIEESRIIYTYEGKPVASASWAPQKFVSVLAGMRGAPEILLIVFADGTISFWTVSWDQVVPNRDAVPMFPSGSPLRVMCTPTKEVSVLLDGGGAISVVCANMSGLHVYPLKDIPSGRVATALAVSKSENAPPSGDVAARPDTEAPVEYLAVTFADGALGVWNVTTKERVSFSTSPGINIKARRVTWLRDVIVVLTETGNVAVLDKSLTTVNSSVYSKALRRPLQSGAFFLPEHRTYIQGTLETQVTSRSVPNSTRAVFDHPPSHLVRDIPLERLPCRGPFGQVITTGISTLARELELYRKTMIPKRISDSIRRACAQRRVDEIALLVSCFFGQQDRERLWYQICLRRQLHSGVPGPVSSGFQASVPERKKLSNETWAPIPYYRAGRFSEVFSLSEAVFCNHVHLNERRTEALERYKREGQDMFAPRFLTARELLKLQQPQKAIDVLMDVNHESDQFPHLSDFAVAIAASVAALKGPSSELLTLTTSRVSALLRARGELDSAVDKYLLSGHYYEAVKTLQMSGRWSGAAALAKLSPINAQHQRELLSRWCSHLMRRGEVMEAARILILLSLSFQAIVLLGESSQFKDIAGLLAIVFLEDASYSTDEHLHEPVTLLTRESDSSEALSLQEVLLDALMDYANLLTSTGNVASAQIVMEYVASLKSRSRGGVSNDTSKLRGRVWCASCVMRGQRSAKFAEYAATYAILKRIGLHQTILIEKRDSSVGYGVFVRDACDSGMPLLVVPSRRACSLSVLHRLGARVRQEELGQFTEREALHCGVLSRLLGCSAEEWMCFAWRLAIERQRSLSPWWGWLSMLPDPLAFKALEEESDRYCRLHHTALHPRLVDVRTQMQEEVCTAYGVIAENNLVPSPSYFRWAVDIILSRSHQLPLCWRSACGNGIELGVLPFIDLINGDDGVSRKRNARVEVAFEVGELPRWYLDEFLRESERRGTDGEGELRRLLDDHFFALVSLERDLAASEEVIMTYELPQWSAGTLKSEDELRLGRLLRYHF